MVAGGILIAVLFPDRKSCGESNPGFSERKYDRKVDGEMFDFVFSYLHVYAFEWCLNDIKKPDSAL